MFLTGLRVLSSSLRCPRPCFDITSLLQGEDEASVADNDFSCFQTLQNPLRATTKDLSPQTTQKTDSTSCSTATTTAHNAFIPHSNRTRSERDAKKDNVPSFVQLVPWFDSIAAVTGPRRHFNGLLPEFGKDLLRGSTLVL